MVKLIKYEGRYIQHFNYNGLMRDYFKKGEIEDLIRNYSVNGKSYILLDDNNEIIGLLGMIFVGKGVAQVWAFINKEVGKNLFYVRRLIIKEIDSLIKRFNLHRVQGMSLKTAEKSNRFIKMLGFTFEACLEQFDEYKNDVNLYKIVVEV